MSDFFEYFLSELFAGEGWAVAVAFIIGIIVVWLINRAIELYRRVQQWFQPIRAPAPQPMQDTPSGCARFSSCLWSGCWLSAIVIGLLLVLTFLVAGDVVIQMLRDTF